MVTLAFVNKVLREGRVSTRFYIYVAHITDYGTYVERIERGKREFIMDNWEEVAYIDDSGKVVMM